MRQNDRALNIEVIPIVESRKRVVVVLDHALTSSDLVWEQFNALFWHAPKQAVMALRGPSLAQKLAELSPVDAEHLPYRFPVVEYIRQQRDQGAEIVLVTAADQTSAQAVAGHLKLFDSCHGSVDIKALTSDAGLKQLPASEAENQVVLLPRPGPDGPLSGAYEIVALTHGTGNTGQKERSIIGSHGPIPQDWMKALKVHHWTKNLILLVPLLVGQLYNNLYQDLAAIAGFILFSAAASAGYLLNSLIDISSDRTHPEKRKRPIPRGKIPIPTAAALAGILGLFGIGGALILDGDFGLYVIAYLAIVLAYSLRFKQEPMVDVLAIGILFLVRMLAALTLLDQPISLWLVSLTFFLFTSLAFAKRSSDLGRTFNLSGTGLPGRGYLPDDRELLTVFGVGSGLLAVVTMLLYFQFKALSTGLYDDIAWLYIVPLVLFSWLMRIWVFAHRHKLHEDPAIFALKDRISWYHASVIAAAWFIADKPGFALPH